MNDDQRRELLDAEVARIEARFMEETGLVLDEMIELLADVVAIDFPETVGQLELECEVLETWRRLQREAGERHDIAWWRQQVLPAE